VQPNGCTFEEDGAWWKCNQTVALIAWIDSIGSARPDPLDRPEPQLSEDLMTTTQPRASIDVDTRSVTRTVRVAARPDAVWRAISEPEHVAGWFGDACETDDGGPFAVGTRGRLHFEGHGWFPFEVTRVEQGRLLAYRWGQSADEPERMTEAEFTLEPDHDGTYLTVNETGFTGDTDEALRTALDGNREGWDGELDELVEYIESRAW
jgi:uncharacterized protein YndB with AHSA1/START domain